MDLGLAEHVYVLTGATRGLGRAVAEVLVAENARVVIGSRSRQRADDTAAALGANAVGIVGDLRDADVGDRLVQTAKSTFGRLDGLLVNHWGPPTGGPFDLDDAALTAALEVGVVGAIRLMRQTVPHIEAGGSVLAVGSTTVEEPHDSLAGSNVTRPGLWGYVKQMSRAVGPSGVRVNMALPGSFGTERLVEIAGAGGASRSSYAQSVPLGRIGEPEEFGRVAAFLLSPAASYVSGAAVRIDGGAVRSL